MDIPFEEIKPEGSDVAPYRPTQRPPLALLTIFDDGSSEGEIIRLRKDVVTIGRDHADVCIPHDEQMESTHIRIRRETNESGHQWVLEDLKTRAGILVRVRKVQLQNDSEFLAGRFRYRYRIDAPVSPLLAAQSSDDSWMPTSTSSKSYPTLEYGYDLGQSSAKNTLRMVDGEYWIGRSSSCSICRSDDSFLADQHVRLFRSSSGSWYAETQGAPNGMWVRVSQMVVRQSCTFQLGEQRFRLSTSWPMHAD